MKELPKRKANRLADYDYSSDGAYFITICTLDMQCILSEIVGADDLGSPLVHLTKYGAVSEQNIIRMNSIYDDITVVNYVIMPNHIHMLLVIDNSSVPDSGAPRSSPPTNTLSKFVTAFKKFTEKEIGERIWQRSYHDHIIRSDEDLCMHIQYIDENPKKWLMGKDEYYA
ncbi:MAG: hypothetical protein E7520_05835 [Ruminococcaceae bacterium]|nr:hypothetical protein [Oscillospiraceae bacterium]